MTGYGLKIHLKRTFTHVGVSVLLTDFRMLMRGLGTGLLGLLSKLSGSVDEPWPVFLACRASWYATSKAWPRVRMISYARFWAKKISTRKTSVGSNRVIRVRWLVGTDHVKSSEDVAVVVTGLEVFGDVGKRRQILWILSCARDVPDLMLCNDVLLNHGETTRR